MTKKAFAIFCCFISSLAFSQTPASPAPKTTYILAGRLFDATADNVRESVVLVVEGERIRNVGSAASVNIPSGPM
jgi:imidazolonepropionase-like amidohydrolase